MKISDFNYDLPEDLIAKYPPKDRTDSRLLVFDNNQIKHEKFSNLLDYLQPNDLLVLNESAVIPARLIGEKETGGKVEVMLERFLSSSQTLVQVRSSRSPSRSFFSLPYSFQSSLNAHVTSLLLKKLLSKCLLYSIFTANFITTSFTIVFIG